MLNYISEQVYQRRYESRRSSKPKLHQKQKKIIMTKTIFNMADGILTPCNVACGSGIVKVNSPSGGTLQCDRGSGMTCHWIRPNVRHFGILHLVSISTTLPLSTCHSAPVSEILSKSDHQRQKKMTSWRFSRWRISAILDFRDRMGSLKNPIT